MSILNVTIPGDLIAVSGLALDIIGIVLLFYCAPEKFPDPQTRTFFAIEPSEIRSRWRKHNRLRQWIATSSVLLIVGGFTVQAIAIIFY